MEEPGQGHTVAFWVVRVKLEPGDGLKLGTGAGALHPLAGSLPHRVQLPLGHPRALGQPVEVSPVPGLGKLDQAGNSVGVMLAAPAN